VKIIIRTLIILAAALLVVGATMGLVSAGVISGDNSFGHGRDGFERQPPPGFADRQPQPGSFSSGQGGREGFGGRPEGFGGREGGRGGIFAVGELLKNLVMIAVIVAVVSLLSRALGTRRPRRR
jgi:hypothetical protein